jgi:hypothetical protein
MPSPFLKIIPGRKYGTGGEIFTIRLIFNILL